MDGWLCEGLFYQVVLSGAPSQRQSLAYNRAGPWHLPQSNHTSLMARAHSESQQYARGRPFGYQNLGHLVLVSPRHIAPVLDQNSGMLYPPSLTNSKYSPLDVICLAAGDTASIRQLGSWGHSIDRHLGSEGHSIDKTAGETASINQLRSHHYCAWIWRCDKGAKVMACLGHQKMAALS